VLRVAEQAFRSDPGRQRTANEDAYYARPPLFAVADGMGGAQAGEVASRIATESFEPAERRDRGPEAFLRSIAEEANERIHSFAEEDQSHQGMGTTLTAALVEGEEVSLAHVGDSRAYLFRDGELRMLTSDHSLVEELRRQGRLTDQEAEEHPQRSIITRALGPEREVEVDTMTYRARPGDVFLLCSDGLTTMVSDERIAAILREAPDLDAAVRRLVREANEAGGRDNITVGAFRLEGVGEPAPTEDETLVGPSAAETGLTAAEVEAAAEPAAPSRRRPRRPPAPAAGPPARRRRLRTAAKIGAVLAVVGLVTLGAWYGMRQVYFLGTDESGRLALYRGLPYDLPLDIELYSEVYSVPVQVSSLPEDRRSSAIDHQLRSRSDAIDLLEDLESEARAPTVRDRGPTGRRPSAGQAGRRGGQGDNR
jgi:serine/threonine protein phosphatase PrpC